MKKISKNKLMALARHEESEAKVYDKLGLHKFAAQERKQAGFLKMIAKR